MQIINITDKKQLNDFVASQPMSQFLQSWEWGEFQKKVSGQVWRLGVLNNDQLIASVKIIAKDLPMGKKYFYCARGPIISRSGRDKETLDLLFKEIKKIAKHEEAMFFRFDPLDQLPLKDKGLKIVKTMDVQPAKTLVLDLSKPLETLLRDMRQKTRYNIKLAEKKGVKAVEAGAERFEEFWQLLDQTSNRDKFRPHGRNYYLAMLKLSERPVKLFFAEYQGRPIATALASFFGNTAAYLHGGSANEERNVMAPYFLQWHLIKTAKANGQKYYDFYGVDEEKWPGVTRFKNGFGGLEVNYPGTFDLVYDPGWYKIYKMIRKVRRTF